MDQSEAGCSGRCVKVFLYVFPDEATNFRPVGQAAANFPPVGQADNKRELRREKRKSELEGMARLRQEVKDTQLQVARQCAMLAELQLRQEGAAQDLHAKHQRSCEQPPEEEFDAGQVDMAAAFLVQSWEDLHQAKQVLRRQREQLCKRDRARARQCRVNQRAQQLYHHAEIKEALAEAR